MTSRKNFFQFARASFASSSPSSMHASSHLFVQRRIHNAIELVPRQRNHRQVHKGLGEVYRSPPKKTDSYGSSVGGVGGTPRRKASEDEYALSKRSEDAYTGIRQSGENMYAPSILSPRRKASQDTATTATRCSEDRERPGVGGASTGTGSDSGSGSGRPQTRKHPQRLDERDSCD